MQARLLDIETVRPHIRTFYFERPPQYHYTAGQFIDLVVPHNAPDDRGTSRQYTLFSSPTEDRLAISSKFDLQRPSTYKQALLGLKPGDLVHISEAMGDFVLPLDERIPIVFVAGGIGITPVRSIARWLTDTEARRDIELHYMVSRNEDAVFVDDLQAAGITADMRITGPAGNRNRLDAATLLHSIAKPDDAMFYIAGASSMVDDMKNGLRRTGVRPYQIVTDSFLGYS